MANQCKSYPSMRDLAPSASGAIPADRFLGWALRALMMSDRVTLHTLEGLAPRVGPPVSSERYFELCALYGALLEETARNLRTLRRAAEKDLVYGAGRHAVRSKVRNGGEPHGDLDHSL